METDTCILISMLEMGKIGPKLHHLTEKITLYKAVRLILNSRKETVDCITFNLGIHCISLYTYAKFKLADQMRC